MTIGVRTPGGWSGGSTSITLTPPASIASGDMMVMFVGAKPYNATITTPSGWARLGTQQTNGITSSGTNTGSVTWTVFYKVAGESESNVTVSITSGNSSSGCIFGYTRTKPKWETPTAYFGSDTSSDTSYSITGSGSSGNITAGDLVLHASVLTSTIANASTHVFSATGLTVGASTESPADEDESTGDNLHLLSAYTAVTSGTASADAVASSTLSSSTTGGGAIVRLRESAVLYYSLYTAEKAAPSAAQVKAGQDVNGNAAVASGSESSPTTTTSPFTFASAATGLSVATAYKVSFVWSDGTNNSTVVTSAAWATTNSGTFSGTDAVDTALFSGVGQATGSFTATDSPDTAAFAGDVYVRGSLAATDAVDTASFAGDVYIRGSLAATETGVDSAGFTASSQVSGSFAATEGADTAAFAGDVLVVGSFSGTDGVDTAIFVTAGGLVGSFSATEDGVDSAFITARGQVFSPEVAANNTWTPVAGRESTWGKTAFAAKDWTREAR